jgi:hypothetical protein
VSLKQLLYSLTWIVPLGGGLLSLLGLWYARHSSGTFHHYRSAFLLNAIGVLLVGLGSLGLDYAYNWTSVVCMMLAALCLLWGNLLIFRHLPR